MGMAAKVLWGEGLFLRPQHFQRQDQYHEMRLHRTASALHPYLWGVAHMEWDLAALKTGTLRLQALSAKLDELHDLGKLKGYLSLSQIVASPEQQAQTRQALAHLSDYWQPLVELGVPQAGLQTQLQQLQTLPPLSIEQALAGPLAEAWRPLWLGQDATGVAAIVSLQGLSDASLLRLQTDGLDGVQLVDRLGELNQLFAATQISAAELKLLSCALILVLLANKRLLVLITMIIACAMMSSCFCGGIFREMPGFCGAWQMLPSATRRLFWQPRPGNRHMRIRWRYAAVNAWLALASWFPRMQERWVK